MTREEALRVLLSIRASEMEETDGAGNTLSQAIDVAASDMRAVLDAERKPMDGVIRAFVEERCEMRPGAQMECAALFGAWVSWCADQGREHPGTQQLFGRNLFSAYPAVSVARPRTGDKRTTVYEGISLRVGARCTVCGGNIKIIPGAYRSEFCGVRCENFHRGNFNGAVPR